MSKTSKEFDFRKSVAYDAEAKRLFHSGARSQLGVLFRSCKGRKDYVGGPNNFASLDLLDRPDELAHWIREVCHV
jgi:hypothetical protein